MRALRMLLRVAPRGAGAIGNQAKSTAERPSLRVRLTALGLHAFVLAALIGTSDGCGDSSDQAVPPPAPLSVAPWERTEEREPCGGFDILRSPYFGDLHIHTKFSADAYIFGTRVGPRGAYDFVKGQPIPLADDDEEQTRSTRIDRALDFAAVTDHAEFFGEVDLCSTPGSPVYDEELCGLLRQAEDPADRFLVTVSWLFPAGVPNPPSSHAFCLLPGVDCDAAAVSVWQEMQAAAEEAYDRSASCTFTSFVGYEHTPSPFGRHRHRNVIFRNDRVPGFAVSQLETHAEGVPQGIWSAVEADCLNAGQGCDALIIPHNSNLSGGEQWLDPAGVAEAQRRQDLEPLVEIYQHKGGSECRFDRLAGRGVDTEDELCTFEQRVVAHEGPREAPPPIDEYPRRNMVRNVLKDGLFFEDTFGVNPFRLGFVGGTDGHNANGGDTEESSWEGTQGNGDSSPARRIGRRRNNPGGLAVAWAEENSRDAIFAALRRREAYATSGTRPVVRFFGGALTDVDCGAADFIERAYTSGTPMGGELGPVRGNSSPRFAVLAAKDPGTAAVPGTDLQRIQIVKGWVDASGRTREKIFEVAGEPRNGAGVDPVTCAPVGRGARELCAVWEDPEFDRSQRAFYYARVLENPTCRWSTLLCKSVGVDPFSPECAAQAVGAGEAFADCCLNEENDAFIEPVIQERAWTSPIWYRPEAIANVEGAVEFGAGPGTDVLDLVIRVGAVPPEFDLQNAGLVVSVTDNDEIFRVTIPAGTLVAGGALGVSDFQDGAAALAGLRLVTFQIDGNDEGVLHLQTDELDLSAADRADHMVRVALSIGTYEVSYTRLWEVAGDRLGPTVGR